MFYNNDSRPTYAPPTKTTTRTTTTVKKTTTTAKTTTTTTAASTARPPYVRPDIAFDGISIVKLRQDVLDLEKLNRNEAGTITIKLELTTTSPNGLVLWKGERNPGFDYDEYEGQFLAVASKTFSTTFQGTLAFVFPIV